MIKITTPLSESTVRKLRVGDPVEISGTIVTARDMAHKYLVGERPRWIKELLRSSIIYHCGPIMRKEKGGYRAVSAGSTTSMRLEPYEADIIKAYSIRGIIGKGGMGINTAAALRKYGCAYFHAPGGAGALLAKKIKTVKRVFRLREFGMPEAMWVIEVSGYPAVVTMDAHGGNIHAEILRLSRLRK